MYVGPWQEYKLMRVIEDLQSENERMRRQQYQMATAAAEATLNNTSTSNGATVSSTNGTSTPEAEAEAEAEAGGANSQNARAAVDPAVAAAAAAVLSGANNPYSAHYNSPQQARAVPGVGDVFYGPHAIPDPFFAYPLGHPLSSARRDLLHQPRVPPPPSSSSFAASAPASGGGAAAGLQRQGSTVSSTGSGGEKKRRGDRASGGDALLPRCAAPTISSEKRRQQKVATAPFRPRGNLLGGPGTMSLNAGYSTPGVHAGGAVVPPLPTGAFITEGALNTSGAASSGHARDGSRGGAATLVETSVNAGGNPYSLYASYVPPPRPAAAGAGAGAGAATALPAVSVVGAERRTFIPPTAPVVTTTSTTTSSASAAAALAAHPLVRELAGPPLDTKAIGQRAGQAVYERRVQPAGPPRLTAAQEARRREAEAMLEKRRLRERMQKLYSGGDSGGGGSDHEDAAEKQESGGGPSFDHRESGGAAVGGGETERGDRYNASYTPENEASTDTVPHNDSTHHQQQQHPSSPDELGESLLAAAAAAGAAAAAAAVALSSPPETNNSSVTTNQYADSRTHERSAADSTAGATPNKSTDTAAPGAHADTAEAEEGGGGAWGVPWDHMKTEDKASAAATPKTGGATDVEDDVDNLLNWAENLDFGEIDQM